MKSFRMWKKFPDGVNGIMKKEGEKTEKIKRDVQNREKRT